MTAAAGVRAAAVRGDGSSRLAHALRLGNLRCTIVSSHERYTAMVAEVYGTPLIASGDAPADLTISIAEDVSAPRAFLGDRLVVRREAGVCTLQSDPVTCRVRAGAAPTEIALVVHDPGLRADLLAYHFWILLNRTLLLLDRVMLHAAALAYRGSVSLFAGDRGAGKSTISVVLAHAGAEVLAEDHVVATRRDGLTVVSGCNDRMRVTAETERHFLNGRLGLATVDVGGVTKKEFPAGRFFAARPHEERPVTRMFFPRVGERFEVRPLSRRAALLRLMQVTGGMLRFHDRTDYADFLSLLADLIAGIPCHELELSPRLADLARLVELLDRGT